MSVRYVPKQGNWTIFLVQAVRAASKGDLILVDNIEMLCYADMGLKCRGFITHSRTDGVVVHIRDETSPVPTVQYGPPLETGIGSQIRSILTPRESQPLVEVDMKSIDLGEKMHMSCQSMEADTVQPGRRSAEITIDADAERAIAQQEAFADAYGDAKQVEDATKAMTLTTEFPQILADGVTVVLGKPGVPNANGDVFTIESWNKAIQEWQEKQKDGKVPILFEVDSMSGAEYPPPTKHTTVKPTDEQIAQHQAAMKKMGTWPEAPAFLEGFSKYRRWMGAETGRWLSQDYTYQPVFFRCVVKVHAPSGSVSILDPQGKEIPFSKVSKRLLILATAFAQNPRAFLEEEAKLAAAMKDNPCADVLPPYNARDVQHTTSMHDKIAKKLAWEGQTWKYVKLDTGVEHEITSEAAAIAFKNKNQAMTDEEVRQELHKAYRRQTAITIPWKSGEALLVPPDLYPKTQKFMCQNCGKQYVYGEAIADMDSDPECGKDRVNYNPLSCCTVKCADDYRAKHMRNPGVGAEILLDTGMCNLVDGTPRPLGKEDFKKSVASVGELLAVDDVAKFFGVEPTHVIHDSVVVDVPAEKLKKLTDEQIKLLKSAKQWVNEKVVNPPVEDEKMKMEEEFRRGMQDGLDGKPSSP